MPATACTSTLRRRCSTLTRFCVTRRSCSGLQVVIVGDIYHSRVARSAIHLLSKFGAHITLCGPPELLPELATCLAPDLHITRTRRKPCAARMSSWCCGCRKNGWQGIKIRLQDYIARYQMTMARMKLAKRDAMVMHPGPIIRGLEITWEVADCPQSAIVEEVANGVPVRMAILAKALGKAR